MFLWILHKPFLEEYPLDLIKNKLFCPIALQLLWLCPIRALASFLPPTVPVFRPSVIFCNVVYWVTCSWLHQGTCLNDGTFNPIVFHIFGSEYVPSAVGVRNKLNIFLTHYSPEFFLFLFIVKFSAWAKFCYWTILFKYISSVHTFAIMIRYHLVTLGTYIRRYTH